MLSLSLGRDGCVKAAAPAPRIECALLRCAAFVEQLVLLREATWRAPGVEHCCKLRGARLLTVSSVCRAVILMLWHHARQLGAAVAN